MSLHIPEFKKVKLQGKDENPVIVPTRAKNFLTTESGKLEVEDVEPETQFFRRTVIK